MLRALRGKIDFSSRQTILEFVNRNKQKSGKDPHYRNPLLDYAKQLSPDDIDALR